MSWTTKVNFNGEITHSHGIRCRQMSTFSFALSLYSVSCQEKFSERDQSHLPSSCTLAGNFCRLCLLTSLFHEDDVWLRNVARLTGFEPLTSILSSAMSLANLLEFFRSRRYLLRHQRNSSENHTDVLKSHKKKFFLFK